MTEFLLLPTKREDHVFTRVCDSVHRGMEPGGEVHPVQVLSGQVLSVGWDPIQVLSEEGCRYILSRSCLSRSCPGPVWGWAGTGVVEGIGRWVSLPSDSPLPLGGEGGS